MGHQSTFSIARRIVPVLISLVLAGYLGFLLFSQYRSKNELEKFYLNGQMQDSEKHATALSYFFSERADDIVRLAESRELSLYFENKALGMSMEYGLSASLLDAKTAFNRFLEKRNLDNKAIYSRVIFLDASGQNLIEAGEESGADTNTTRKFFKSYVMKHAKTPVITAEGRDEDSIVTISFPYRFKRAYCGQIIAQIQLGTIYRQFVHQPDNKANQMIRMLLYQHTYIYSAALDGWEIDPENLQLPEKLEDNKRYQLITPGEKGVKHTINIYTTPIADTPFSLSTCVVEKEQSLSNSPKLWIIVTGSIGLIILFGAIVIIRTTLHNEVLNVRLNEIRIREKAIDEKNRSLQKLTAAVEQSANCVIITGTNGIIEYVNPYFSELTGVSTEEAVGNGLDILEPDSGSMDDFNKFCQGIGW